MEAFQRAENRVGVHHCQQLPAVCHRVVRHGQRRVVRDRLVRDRQRRVVRDGQRRVVRDSVVRDRQRREVRDRGVGDGQRRVVRDGQRREVRDRRPLAA